LAAGLFATLAGTQFLGALATYDAMALFLLVLAAWLGVRSASRQFPGRTALLITAGVVLAVADAVKYATVLYAPVVLAAAALAVWQRHGKRAGLVALATVLCSWLAPLTAALAGGGRQYWLGITASTLTRQPSDAAMTTVIRSAYIWTSLILVLAILGTVLASRSDLPGRLLPAALTAAALLAPAAQATLHTTVGLQKHVVFGAWFAAIAAGYAMARLSRVDRGYGWAPVMALPIAASTLFGSMGQAASLYRTWPDSTHLISTLSSAIRSHPGHYLAEDYDVEAYYLHSQAPWPHWSSTYYFRYGAQPVGAASYAAAISHHYFSLIVLDFGDTSATDAEITADMRDSGGYYVLGRAGRSTVWATRAPAMVEPSGGGRGRD
jgi:hypothetical protein